MKRCILHIDANNFYASVEQALDPTLKGKALCVAGSPDMRKGIVLAKSQEAKVYGVTTAEALWQARKKCPHLLVLPPHYEEYARVSKALRMLCYSYTPFVEPFGSDEVWIDITEGKEISLHQARRVAEDIIDRVRCELDIKVSVGISWNKPFAKLGSDIDVGGGVVSITPETMPQVVWPRRVRDLLFVGAHRTQMLNAMGIITIGDLAHAEEEALTRRFGIVGMQLKQAAAGNDPSRVKEFDLDACDAYKTIASIGNGETAPRDMENHPAVKSLLFRLAESVGSRMRAQHLQAQTVRLEVRRCDLSWSHHQTTLSFATSSTQEIFMQAWKLFCVHESSECLLPCRALRVSVAQFSSDREPCQLDLFGEVEAHMKRDNLDRTIDALRARYGNTCVLRLGELHPEGVCMGEHGPLEVDGHITAAFCH